MSKKLILFFFCIYLLLIFFNIIIFYPIFTSNNILISFAINPFNICTKYPNFWFYFKLLYVLLCIISKFTVSFLIVSCFSKPIKNPKTIINNNPTGLHLLIGHNISKQHDVFIPEKSLYQNLLITGTIGSGKTSSAIYPFSKQLIKYENNSKSKKLGILCLDVKGNFHKQIYNYAKQFNRLKDLIIIGLNSNKTYNPLDKPYLNSLVLANRLKTILTLISPNNSESFWLDKAEQILSEAIKLCRLYNKNYVNFIEIHKLINDKKYYYSKIEYLRTNFMNNTFSNEELYNLTSSINFFEKEFYSLDDRTISILKSEITRITLPFISNYKISKLFSPHKCNITYKGFKDLIYSGKIVVLSMNISEYTLLSKILATYMKLDFQAEVMNRISSKYQRPVAFICDEYQEYITASDANFFLKAEKQNVLI